jgi:alpha-beta hydrolase superfamily lysophospholipase
LEVGFRLPALKQVAAEILSRCWPTAPLPMNLNSAWLSHDPAIVTGYQTDPLVHNRMTARSYRAILQARDEAMARTSSLHQPVLLLCGAQDRVIAVEAAQRWFERLTCEKRQVIFPDCYHELHHEPVFPDVVRLVREWVESDG